MARAEVASSAEGQELSSLQRAILLTVLYSDLFDYPLTEAELHRYLTVPHPGADAFEAEMAGLTGRRITRTDGLICLRGREDIVDVRRRRGQTREQRWIPAQRFARWLRYVPFLRMAAVCGSQAAGNPRADADVDFFLVTEPNRLWTVQVCSMFLRRVASLLSVRICPNYILTKDSLDVTSHDLYHAREVAQTVPMWGGSTYAAFREANRWIERFLPNVAHADDRRDLLTEAKRPRLTRVVEWLLGGWPGNVLERTIHRLLLLYYPLRLYYLGWRREHFRRAYRSDRQEVMRGGYGPIIERAFRESAAAHLGDSMVDADVRRLFPPGESERRPDDLYARLFSERYGGADE